MTNRPTLLVGQKLTKPLAVRVMAYYRPAIAAEVGVLKQQFADEGYHEIHEHWWLDGYHPANWKEPRTELDPHVTVAIVAGQKGSLQRRQVHVLLWWDDGVLTVKEW